jgi:hypothetical protein
LEKPVEPQNPTMKVYPNENDTGRGSSSIRASDISSGGRPVSGALGTVIEISYHGNSKYGYVLSTDWNAYVKYKNEKKQYEKDLAAYNTAIASMDTGGYTGSWGSEGKLAMLH